jgi:hypothetical protein
MYSSRDFDSAQLLIRRDRELRHGRSSDRSLDLQQILPWNAQALRRDLGLDVVCQAMSGGDGFLYDVAQVALLSSMTDLQAIGYRQRIVADALNNAPVVRSMYQIAIEAIEAERKNYWSFSNRYPTRILHRAVDVLQAFVGMLKRLRRIADEHSGRFASEGFARLFAMLQHELGDGYFAEIEQHLHRLKFRDGILVSARLGVGNKGRDYVLRRSREDKRGWLAHLLPGESAGYTFRLHPRDEAGARALAELGDRGVNLVADALARSTDHILSFFHMLRTELAFHVGCLNLHEQLRDLGEPICFPRFAPCGDRNLSFTELYDASLALSAGAAVVANDVEADGTDIVVITGANSGGKSTFLRSFGIAQLMMQAGMFVPARRFSAEVCTGLFTHFKREEDSAMESGKLDEELSRMSDSVDRLRSGSLMLFNESFAATNEREGSEIASQIVRAILDSGVKVFFVTHLYDFAHSFFIDGGYRAKFLRAGRRPDGSRSFRLIEGEPLETTYGEDLYRAIFSERAPPEAATGFAKFGNPSLGQC